MLSEQEAPLNGSSVEGLAQAENDREWLDIVREAYSTSTDYFEAEYRFQLEKNRSNFQAHHPVGSKYHTDAYKSRSRIYRPKLRAAQLKAEAAFATAMFSTTDVINIDAVNQDSKDDDRLAEIWEAVLNHRIKHDIPWFITGVAAFQKSRVDGCCISRQSWEYRDRVDTYTTFDAVSGDEQSRVKRTIDIDKPVISLIEIENVRFSAAANWIDPLNTSPYLIEIIPMFVNDVLERMVKRDTKSKDEPWFEYSKEELIAANDSRDDSKKEEQEEYKIKEFAIVYVFRNIISRDGDDWEFYSVGSKLLLTDPKILKSPNGRGYVLGVSNVEAHKAIPASSMELGQGLQAEANDMVNLTLDNVKMALNKRKYAQRGKGTDLGALQRVRLGGVVITDDINSIREEDVRDMTGSSYQVQDRLNVDIDDIVGGFSAASVASNRSLNQTVGGMQMISNSTNAITEYVVRCFVETWVEPVLNHIVALLQAYENKDVIDRFATRLEDAAQEELPPGVAPQPKKPKMSDADLLKTVKVTAAVGLGNLDPKLKVQALTQAIASVAQLSPELVSELDGKVLFRELVSVLGYRNGQKFLKDMAAQPQQPQQDAGQAAMAQAKMAEIEVRKAEIEQRNQIDTARLAQEKELKMYEMTLKYGGDADKFAAKMGLEKDKHNLQVLNTAKDQEVIKKDREEMMLKQRMGSGI